MQQQQLISRKECGNLFRVMRSMLKQIEQGLVLVASDGVPLFSVRRGVYASIPAALDLWVKSWRQTNAACGIRLDQSPIVDLCHAMRNGVRANPRLVASVNRAVNLQQVLFERKNGWRR